METLAAISLAGNILQFLDTARSLVATANQLRSSGSTAEHRELALLANELRDLLQRVTQPDTPASGPHSARLSDEPLYLLSVQCEDVASELLGLLQGLDIGKYAGKLETAVAVLRTRWKKGEIEALQSRLDRLSRAVDLHLSFYDRRKVFARIDDLAEEYRRLQVHRAGEIRQLKAQFDDLFAMLASDRRRATTLLVDVSGKGLKILAEQALLEQLRFYEMDQRKASIQVAHEQTLTWVFGEPKQSSPATFEDWLSTDDDLFWISGKPGSGKSTLMKYISCHPRTDSALSAWARGRPMIRAEYFFWRSSGMGLHKSQQGLLRSIIYRILREHPELIVQVYPEAFAAANSVSGSAAPELPTSMAALLQALQRISFQMMESNACFCFFIDGLDEYEGKPFDIIEVVGHLRTLPNVKICVSSRPWNEFEHAFGSDGAKKLYMQDFNKADINAYLDGTFLTDSNFEEIEPEDRIAQGAALIHEISEAANGVFLWVYLVVKSFQEGLLNGDRLVDLRRRLEHLPTDLNQYYWHILTSHIQEFYHEQAAFIFAVTEAAFTPLPLMAYWYLGEECDNEAQDSVEFVQRLGHNALETARIDRRLNEMRRRLNACSKGLLEVQNFSHTNASSSEAYFDTKVVFLHRTVKDFLKRPDSTALLHNWKPVILDIHGKIANALVSQIKTAPKDGVYWDKHDSPGNMIQATAQLHIGVCDLDHQRALETILRDVIRVKAFANLLPAELYRTNMQTWTNFSTIKLDQTNNQTATKATVSLRPRKKEQETVVQPDPCPQSPSTSDSHTGNSPLTPQQLAKTAATNTKLKRLKSWGIQYVKDVFSR